MPKKKCDHQRFDSDADEFTDHLVSYNYCPWCGVRLNQTEDKKDDCQKRGCAD